MAKNSMHAGSEKFISMTWAQLLVCRMMLCSLGGLLACTGLKVGYDMDCGSNLGPAKLSRLLACML